MGRPRYNLVGERIVRGPYKAGLTAYANGTWVPPVQRAERTAADRYARRDRTRARRYVSRALVELVRRALAASSCNLDLSPRERRDAVRTRTIAIVTDVLVAAARAAIFCVEEAIR